MLVSAQKNTRAALTGLNVGLPSDSPYYADFFLGGLKTTYSYVGGTGIGTFNISNVSGTPGETYTIRYAFCPRHSRHLSARPVSGHLHDDGHRQTGRG